jgi:hypothetical protein
MTTLSALAQSTAPTTPATKPSAASPAKVSPPVARPAPARQSIELTPAERQSIDAQATPPTPKRSDAEELVPTAADLLAPPPPEESSVRIEQFRNASRVTEVKVFPSFGGPTYVMTNREGRQPLFQTDLGPGLSVPKFFRFEFGSPNPAPAAAPPPPTR